jgi:AcrR family transcriptional regulator
LTEKYPNGYYRVDHPMPSATRVKRPVASHARDPQRTRDRILAAALAEFSAEGFAGARVARIARRARVNKRMLYHYFGNKEDLFRGIFDRKLVQRAAWLTEAPPDLGASLAYWFQLACEDSDWIRLVQWEALGLADQPVIREDERRASFARALGDLRARQRRGLLPADLDAGHLLLAIMGLVAYPLAFPQLTRMVTGRRATDPGFRAERAEFLRRFAAALTGRRPEAAGASA